MKTVYSCDRQTGEFLGEDQAQPSPMEPGKYLMPACSTELQPPVAGANECAVFRDGKWSIVSDWRFVRHWDLETGKLCEPIVELGQEPTKTQTSQEPALPELAAHQALEWDKKAKAFKTIPDWRGVPLWSTKTAMFDPISKLGQWHHMGNRHRCRGPSPPDRRNPRAGELPAFHRLDGNQAD